MGNVAFPALQVELMSDAELEARVPGSAAICGQAIANKLSEPKPHEFSRKVILQSDRTEHLCIKLRKGTQLQLRTLFQACKKQTAAAALAISNATVDSPPPPCPIVPVIAVYIRVNRGALKSAFMAVNKPFPSKRRHTWAWTPGVKSKRPEPSTLLKTIGHQFAADQPPNTIDPSLGPTGCIFDMHAAATEFFAVSQYFLSLNSMEDSQISGPNIEKGTYHGGTEVTVTARILLRTLPAPAKPSLKSSGIKSKEQQEAAEEKARLWAEKEAARKQAAKEEEEKEAQRKKEQAEEWAKKKKEEDDATKATEEAERVKNKPIVIAGPNPDEPDPFATPRATSDELEQKYGASGGGGGAADDPLADSPRPPLPAANDPFANEPDDVAAAARKLQSLDPFASLPPTPVPTNRPAGGLDLLDAVDVPPLPLPPTNNAADDDSLDSDRTDVLANETAPASSPLSPDLLADLESNRPTPQQALSDRESLSLASTPMIKPVPKDLHALDQLPDQPLSKPAPKVVPTIPASELSVPFESLPANKPKAPIDVLSSVPTPRLEPKPEPEVTISRLPTPVLKPAVANPAALDRITLAPEKLPPTKDTHVLDGVPTPQLKPTTSTSKESLDSMPAGALPPSSSPRLILTAPPVTTAQVDALLNSGDTPTKLHKKKKATTLKPVEAPRLPITRATSIAQRPVTITQPIAVAATNSPLFPSSPARTPTLTNQANPLDALDDLPTPTKPPSSTAGFDDSLFDDSSILSVPATRPTMTVSKPVAVSSLDDDSFFNSPSTPAVKPSASLDDSLFDSPSLPPPALKPATTDLSDPFADDDSTALVATSTQVPATSPTPATLDDLFDDSTVAPPNTHATDLHALDDL